MRRPTAVVAAVLMAAALAAAAAARDPRQPREAFTPADRAWAQRIVLDAADLPRRWQSSTRGRASAAIVLASALRPPDRALELRLVRSMDARMRR